MRLKQVLDDIDDVAILYKYLYLDPNHKVTFNNGLTDLQIHMTDGCAILCKNMSFPDLPETNFSDTVTLIYAMGIIGILKNTAPEEFPQRFSSRWDEIKTITQANCALNQLNRRGI